MAHTHHAPCDIPGAKWRFSPQKHPRNIAGTVGKAHPPHHRAPPDEARSFSNTHRLPGSEPRQRPTRRQTPPSHSIEKGAPRGLGFSLGARAAPGRGSGGTIPAVRRTRWRMPSGLVRPLCRAGCAPPGRETVRAPYDTAKPGLAPGTGPTGPAATRAGACTAGFLARRASPAPRHRYGRQFGPQKAALSLGLHTRRCQASSHPDPGGKLCSPTDHGPSEVPILESSPGGPWGWPSKFQGTGTFPP